MSNIILNRLHTKSFHLVDRDFGEYPWQFHKACIFQMVSTITLKFIFIKSMTESFCDAWIYHYNQNIILLLIAFPENPFFAVGVNKSDSLKCRFHPSEGLGIETFFFSPHPYLQGGCS